MRRVPMFVLALAAAACGGGGGGGSSSSPTPTAPSPTVTSAATITVGSSGVEPKEVRIQVGQTVQFVNNGASAVEIMSDPHPAHNACPAINEVGRLAPGQRRTTGAFTREGGCGFHDTIDDSNRAMRGSILVGESATPPPTDGYGSVR